MKDKTYYDKCGNEIMEGDLIEVFHFRSRHGKNGRVHYMYQIVTLEEGYYRARSFNKTESHYNLKALANNLQILPSVRVLARDLEFVDWDNPNDPRLKDLLKTPKNVKMYEQKPTVDS